MARLDQPVPPLAFELAQTDQKLLLRGVQSWFTLLDEYKDEVTDFVTMRLAKDGAAVHDYQRCTSATDVIAVQSRWAAEAVQDFGAEMGRFWSLLAKFGPTACPEAAAWIKGPRDPVPGFLFY